MKRLNFIFLLLLSFVGKVFAMKPKREAMARAWLKENGFGIRDETVRSKDALLYSTSIYFAADKNSARRMVGIYPPKTAALNYLAWLDAKGFVIEEKHVHYEIVSSVQRDDRDVDCDFREVEDAPPTLHRFTRTEWL